MSLTLLKHIQSTINKRLYETTMNFKDTKEAIMFANEYLVSGGFFNQITLTASPIHHKNQTSEQSIDIVEHLYQWSLTPINKAKQNDRARLCYLFGDFGSGKSGVCKSLISKLYHTYEENRFTDTMAKPTLPLYFNLRLLTGIYGELDFANKSLAELIEVMFCVTGVPKIAGDDIIKLVRQYPCVVVFDGFDEAVQKLGKNQQNGFLNKLLSILPSVQYTKDLMRLLGQTVEESTIPDSPSRLVISCRTQLFESKQELTAFSEAYYHTEMSKNGIQNYQAYQLDALPATTIRQEIKRDIQLLNKQAQDNSLNKPLDTSHPDCHAFLQYLVDLSISPLMLSLAKSLLPNIQPALDTTGTINSADMFTDLITKLMQRDSAKSTINIKEKQKILGSIALKLWQDRAGNISLENLRSYFFDYYSDYQQLQLGINTGRVELETAMQDLHSSMLVRNDYDMYAFYHPLIGDYFLAVGLFELVRNSKNSDDLKQIANFVFTNGTNEPLDDTDTLPVDSLIFISQMVVLLIIRGDMHSYNHVYSQWLNLCEQVTSIENKLSQQKAMEMWELVIGDEALLQRIC